MESTYITPRQNGQGTYIYGDGSTLSVDISTKLVDFLDLTNIVGTYGPRRSNSVEFFLGNIGIEQNSDKEANGQIQEYIKKYINKPYLYSTYLQGKDGVIFIPITLTPNVFAAWAAAYDSEKEDRKIWLKDQIKKLEESWKQYQIATADLQIRAAQFDGQFGNLSKWISAVGAIAISTANPYAVGASVVVQGALAVATIFKRKIDKEASQPYIKRAEKLAAEMKQIADYYTKYNKELSGNTLVIALIIGAVILANNK